MPQRAPASFFRFSSKRDSPRRVLVSRRRISAPFSNQCTLSWPPSSLSWASQRNFSAPPPSASGVVPSGSSDSACRK